MEKKLVWTTKDYGNSVKEFVATILRLNFLDRRYKQNQSLELSYSIHEEEHNFVLSVSFNDLSFDIGEYKSLELAYTAAEKHYQEFIFPQFKGSNS